MVKSLICCLFMLRKFSTQSGLTDLQHASLEDKVWFDCREFTWHRLRFYILASLCLFEYLIVSHLICPGGVQVLLFTFYRLVRPFSVLRRWSKNVFGNHQLRSASAKKQWAILLWPWNIPFSPIFQPSCPPQARTSQLPSQPRPCRQFCASGNPNLQAFDNSSFTI